MITPTRGGGKANSMVGYNGGTLAASFVYDGDGVRVKGTVNGVTTIYVGEHYEMSGTTVKKYYYSGGTRVAERVVSGGSDNLYYLLTDHLGSTTRVLTSPTVTRHSEQRYNAWGTTRYTYGSLPTSFTYTGQRAEAALGIMFYKSRWFDPVLGRFLQPDSIVPLASQGVTAHDRYAAMNNNPVRFTDPSGHMVDCDRDEWSCSYHWDEPIYYDDSKFIYDVERPISGVHVGVSHQAGYGGEIGGYNQLDVLWDWKEGDIYLMETTGGFLYGGTPTGVDGEFYFGTTNVHGIEWNETNLGFKLAGPNIDLSGELGVDALAIVGVSYGVSVDLDENNKYQPIYDPLVEDIENSHGVGFQYSYEQSVLLGMNAAVNLVEGGLQGGSSYSKILASFHIPWWPW